MVTKFRAFQLDCPGSLFSYYGDNHYTLIEAMLPKAGIEAIRKDLELHGKEKIDTLHISSWDDDHCNSDALTQIMNQFRPAIIQVPSYDPTTDSGKLCQKLIQGYDRIHQFYTPNIVKYDKKKIDSLIPGSLLGTNDIVYHSFYDVDNKNDMSQIRLFRSSGFSVLSMGDCESVEIAKNMMNCSILKNELDVLIYPHHGSENSSIHADFLKYCKPRVSICSSNHGNEYEHPRQSVVNMLNQHNVDNFTTKHGDIILFQETVDTKVRLLNYVSNNGELQQSKEFSSKRQDAKVIEELTKRLMR